jgi:hypothetical protein
VAVGDIVERGILASTANRARRLRIAALLHYLADVLTAEGSRPWLTQVRYLGATVDDADLDDEHCLLDLLRKWSALPKSDVHNAPLLWRDNLDERARAQALPEAALNEIGRLLDEYSRLP